MMAMGPLRPEEREAIFVRGVIVDFIEAYISETQGQNLEEFDRLDLSSQKNLLKSGYYGYKNISGTLEGFSKATSRMVGKRTNNNSRAEENFINARKKYLIQKKKNDLKTDQTFKSYLDYNENNYSISTPRGGRVHFLSFLNKLPGSNAKNTTMSSLSESGKYSPDENITFPQDLLHIFPASAGGAADAASQSAGKRRNRTKKLRRNKAKKSRRN